MTLVPDARIRCWAGSGSTTGRYVLYWMVGARRLASNPALDRALTHARRRGVGVLVFEPLRLDYPWAAARFHAFVLQGMVDNAAAAAGVPGVTYFPYVEPQRGDSRGLLDALAAHAAVVVTDDVAGFFQQRMVERVAPRRPCSVEAVDGHGLVPMRAPAQAFPTAFAFRRYLQATLATVLLHRPSPTPFATPLPAAAPEVPAEVRTRWPAWDVRQDVASAVTKLAIDQSVGVVADRPGGPVAAATRLERFVSRDLARYVELRNDPDADVTSGLSPYLHFGHLSAHDVFHAVMQREGWLGDVPRGGRGARAGWWGVSAEAEGFLDQLVTWRELGANTCVHLPEFDTYAALPAWARATLATHAGDVRDPLYAPAELDAAATYDAVWNAAQRELRRDGRLHNYLRMLWGKKILQWSASPEQALATMIDLNNRYALDGRDPNSYSGIFWTLGRYDRPWGPERDIFGTIRYMSSDNTVRKVKLKAYLERYAAQPGLF
ncbi:MAG: deoxyribodipyrimidine photolyase [Candidatus Binatia bacterium]